MSALQSGTVQIASNGLVKEGCGTYVVILDQAIKKYTSRAHNENLDYEVTAHIDNMSAANVNNQARCFPGVAAHAVSDIDLLQEIWAFLAENIKVQWTAIGSTFDSLSLFNKRPMKIGSICFNTNTKQLALLGYT
eukprot:15365557-Ditylum_brightwellii.AAC.1